MQNTHNLKSSSLTATSPSPHSYYQHPRHNNHQHQQYNKNSSDSDMVNAAAANPLTNRNHDEYGSIHNLHGLSTASLASAFASLSNNRNNVSGSSFHSFSPSITSNSDGHSNQSDAFSALLLSSLSQMNHPTASPPRANDPLHSQWQPPPRPPPSANPPRAPPSSSKRKAKLADFASLLSSARHAGMSEAVVGATNEELSGFFAVRRPLPSGRSSLLSLRGAAPPPSISCSSLVLRRRSRGNGKGRKKGSGGVRNRADGERPAVLEMAVPFYTTPDTASVTPKTILANFVRSMEELMESRWKARGADSSGDRPFEMGTVMTRFETMSSSDSSSSSFDGNDREREQSPGDGKEEDDDLTFIRLQFCATLDVRICDRVETVEVTAPVTLSGKFESSSSRAAEGEEDHDSEDDREHEDDDLFLAAVDLTFDCVRLLETMIGRAGELVDLARTQAAERAIAPRRPQHQAAADAVPAVSPLGGTVGDAGSLLAGLALNAAAAPSATETDHAHGRTPSHNSLDSETPWRTRAEALLGMGNYPSTKTLGTVDTLRSNVSGSSSGSGDTRVSGSGHRDDDYSNIFKELGSSSGSLSSDTFQRALAALTRSHDSRGMFGTAGVASGATLASLSSSALAGNGSANGHGRHNNYRNNSSHIINNSNNNNNNLEELAVSDLTKSYLGSLLSLASFGGASSNSNSLKSLKDLEHFSFGSFLPSCSSSLNARARPVGGGGTRTRNHNYYNHNPKGENEFLSLSRRLGLKPPSSSANTSRKTNHPSNPTSSANHRRTSLSMMQHDDGSGNANATFDSSLTQLLAAAASNVTGSIGNNGATDSNPIGIKTNNVVRFSDNTNFLKAPYSPTPTWSRSSFGGGGLGLAQKYSANVHGTNGVAASDGSANMAPSASNAAGSLSQKILMNSLMNHSGSNNPLLQLAQQQQLLRQLKQEAQVKMPGQQEPRDRPQSKQKHQPQSQQIQIQPQQQQPQSQQQQQQQQQPVQPKSSNIHQGLFSWLENDSMFLSEEQLKEQDAIDAELERKRREAPMPLRFFTAAEEGDGNLEMVGETLFGSGLGKKGKKNTGIGGNSRKKRKTS